jgi:hypothetical protein
MTTYCLIKNGAVANRTTFDTTMPTGWATPGDTWVADENAQIGWMYANGVFTAPAVPPPPLPSTNPNDYPLRPDQFFAMLDIAGLTASVNAAIDAISDPTAKAIAKAKFNHTQVFNRSNPLFETLKAGVGVTDAQIDAMWMQAKDIP